MHMINRLALVFAVVAVGLSASTGLAGDVRIGVDIGVPAPPVIVSPPPLALVPGTEVYTAPSASFNFFVYGGRYYSFHNNGWFVAAGYGAPWVALAPERVPVAVRTVPVTYYAMPPGQAKKGGNFCPPGLAKQGRC